MSKNRGDNRPHMKPVTRIELSENNVKLRWVLIIVLVCVAAAAFTIGIQEALDVQPGWNEITVNCDEPNYGREFHLMYDFSESGGNAAAVNKSLTELYSRTMEDAYRIFSKDADISGVHNLYYLNRHVNQEVTVEPSLYTALELLVDHGNRCIYLAPVYVEYNRVFNAESDAEAAQYDPSRNEETANYISQLMHYISDDAHIQMELLGDNRVILYVSDDFLSFALENGIEEYLDLAWMRNAFVADYVSEILMEQGYHSGYLASFDGFNRSLGTEETLNFNIYDRQGSDIYIPGKMHYSGSRSIVFLRDYPLRDMDQWSYHVYADGSVTSTMIDPKDGRSKAARHNLVGYAEQKSCSEILLELIPVYLADSFAQELLGPMEEKGIYTIWCDGSTVYSNDKDLELTLQEKADGVLYKIEYVK